jgi:hypothetical protein
MQNMDYHVGRFLQAERDNFMKFTVQSLSGKWHGFSVVHEIPRLYVT